MKLLILILLLSMTLTVYADQNEVLELRRYVKDRMSGSRKGVTPQDIYKLTTQERLDKGCGWCDQLARVFMDLASRKGIQTRMVFLFARFSIHQHTIVEAKVNGRWVIIDLDPDHDLILYNNKGELASREDLLKDPSILYNNPTIKELAEENPLWADEDFLSMYYNDLARVR